MPVLRSRLDPSSTDARANVESMTALVADLRDRQAAVAGRGAGGDEASIARHRERGKLPVRERIDRLLDPATAFLELSPLAAGGHVRRRGTERRDRHRDRPDRGHDLRDRRQRRHGQGRHLLPDHRQEAPPGPGDRAREPAALRLPRRQRRGVPAAPGRGVPGPRPLRPDLLQPGPAVGGRHPADRPGDGLVDRRRGLRPGDERRDGDRPGHRDDLPRRPAAGEGRDRRGRHCRGARRRERPRPGQRRRRPRGARRRARPRARPVDRRQPQPPAARAALGSPPAGTARRGPRGRP